MGKVTKKIVDNRDKEDSNPASLPNAEQEANAEQEENWQLRRSSTESHLCQGKFYEECPSSALTDTFYTAVVAGMDFWEVRETSLNGGKDFSKGRIDLQIRDRYDLTDFAEIAYQVKEVIAQQFGEQTLKLHYALAIIAFRQPQAWKRDFKVSASKLLADFGEDKKFQRYIPKSKREAYGKPAQYFPKRERLEQIIHQAQLLKRVEVWVREWRLASKKILTVEMSNLWDIFAITEVVQMSTDGNNTLVDVEISYRPGKWFEKFANHKYLREFGYITGEALKLDPYREKMALRLAYFALFALQQHRSGRYQLETLLRRIGYGKEIEEAKTDPSAASNLKRSFDRALKILGNFEYPYSFEYYSNTPEWVRPDSQVRKPKKWFETWLQLSGTLTQPEALPKRGSKPQEEPPKRSTQRKSAQSAPRICDLLVFGQQVRTARKATGESLRAMAQKLEISPSQLSQIENGRYPHPLNPCLKARIVEYFSLDECLD
jgi:DNA-binding XRE family transcriptional regulator